jgi:hypothetical protein
MSDWMRSLAGHCVNSRIAHPEDDLLVVFAIDGTILDMGHLVSHVLNEFDRGHGTQLFDGLRAEDVDVHENEIETLLDRRRVLAATRVEVLAWYRSCRWAPGSVLMPHRPYGGVFEVIRWFQIQPRTSVALNTGRPGTLRDATLRCLNELGREYKVALTDELLVMNPDGWEVDVAKHKVAGIRHLQQAGYRVVAVVDNGARGHRGPGSRLTRRRRSWFLDSQTLYQSRRRSTPRTVGAAALI